MPHEVSVVSINAGDEESADITLEYNTKRINIPIFASAPTNSDDFSLLEASIETRIIGLLNEAIIADGDKYDTLIEEVLDDILHVGQSMLSEAAPPTHHPHPTSQDLQSLLYPECLYFRLQTIGNKAAIFPISPDETVSLPDAPTEPRLDSTVQPEDQLCSHSAKDVVVEDLVLGRNGIIGRSQVAGRDMLCKARREGLWDLGFKRALQKIQKLNASIGKFIRVPDLHGYVTYSHSDAIIGLLREWIPFGPYGKTVRNVNVLEVPLDTRQKWADQIRQTVADLHEIGVTWGDGKPSNVVVDQSGDIWLIDFAGGRSRGWVDEQLAETVEGDHQAVEKVLGFFALS